MSKRRRTATPIFQKPLTIAEFEGKDIEPKSRGRPILCQECHLAGGTLVEVKDTCPQEYRHQDIGKCAVLKLRK